MVVLEGRKAEVAHYAAHMVVEVVKKVAAVGESLRQAVEINQYLLFLLSFLHISFPIILVLLFIISEGCLCGTVILSLPDQLLVVMNVWCLGW